MRRPGATAFRALPQDDPGTHRAACAHRRERHRSPRGPATHRYGIWKSCSAPLVTALSGTAGCRARAPYAMRLSHQFLQRLDFVGFGGRLIPADTVEAWEAQGEAGFVARRFMHAVELELGDQ